MSPRSAPRIASVGADYPCPEELPIATFLGEVLPEPYLRDPTRLASDWDILVLCPRVMPVEDIAALEVVVDRFVRVDGGGLVVTEDYINPGWRPPPIDSERMDAASRLIAPAGFRFLPIFVPHSRFEVGMDCVPDV